MFFQNSMTAFLNNLKITRKPLKENFNLIKPINAIFFVKI